MTRHLAALLSSILLAGCDTNGGHGQDGWDEEADGDPAHDAFQDGRDDEDAGEPGQDLGTDEADLGPDFPTDGPSCGNGVLEPGEECEEGDSRTCTTGCGTEGTRSSSHRIPEEASATFHPAGTGWSIRARRATTASATATRSRMPAAPTAAVPAAATASWTPRKPASMTRRRGMSATTTARPSGAAPMTRSSPVGRSAARPDRAMPPPRSACDGWFVVNSDGWSGTDAGRSPQDARLIGPAGA